MCVSSYHFKEAQFKKSSHLGRVLIWCNRTPLADLPFIWERLLEEQRRKQEQRPALPLFPPNSEFEEPESAYENLERPSSPGEEPQPRVIILDI